MPIINRLIITAAATAIALALPKPGLAETNMLFILDGSNSMWGQVEGKPKIKTAQNVLASLIPGLPKDTKVGLMVYGHRSGESCDDIEILSPIGADGPAELVRKIRSIQPKGKTPIAGALLGSLIAFSKLEGQNNHVVLISDGIETCGGDVCMAASVIANANIKARVHVVGFDVGAKERAQLECIPKMGNGKYFSAANAGELKKAIAQVKQMAQAAPKPKKKAPKEVFRDDFNGENLSDHWEVLKPDPDSFIVEKGTLLAINSTPASLAKGNIQNLFRLTKPLPKGDWTATAKIRVDFQSLKDRVFFGLYHDKKNYVVNTLSLTFDPNYGQHFLVLSAYKALKGKIITNSRSVWGTKKGSGIAGVGQGQPYLLRLQKTGRKYMGSIKLEGAKKPQWISLPAFRLLRSKGGLAIGLFQDGVAKGETSINVDWVKIETKQ